MSARKVALAQGTPAASSNVVQLRAVMTAAEIEAEVVGRSRRGSAELTARMKRILTVLNEQHEERLQDALPLGRRMSRSALESWIEMGQRLLAQGGGR